MCRLLRLRGRGIGDVGRASVRGFLLRKQATLDVTALSMERGGLRLPVGLTRFCSRETNCSSLKQSSARCPCAGL